MSEANQTPKAEAARTPTEIVVGFDGSAAAEEAVRHAARRVSPAGHVTIVFALGPAPELLPGVFDRDRLRRAQRERGQAIFDALLMESDETLLDCDFDLLMADEQPAVAICATAADLHADEIVVGSRGLGRARAAVGSVSHEVVRLSDRPVVVIPHGSVHGSSGAAR